MKTIFVLCTLALAVLFTFYLQYPSYLLLAFLILLALCSVVFLATESFAPFHLRRKLSRLSDSLDRHDSALLQEEYLKMHRLYLNLPHKHKHQCYPALSKVREKIETLLQTEKKLETLLGHKTISPRHYQEISSLLSLLPPHTQEKYALSVSYLKQRLER